ncbi:MAG: hypothetical protein QOJ51_590, partial [Acidobacteriaceae bacterium]|nr:hypothetical protein [Acidobacteriaceae bacterium]
GLWRLPFPSATRQSIRLNRQVDGSIPSASTIHKKQLIALSRFLRLRTVVEIVWRLLVFRSGDKGRVRMLEGILEVEAQIVAQRRMPDTLSLRLAKVGHQREHYLARKVDLSHTMPHWYRAHLLAVEFTRGLVQIPIGRHQPSRRQFYP